MRLSEFDFELPEDLIALRPAEPRESARLLHVAGSRLQDRTVADLAGLLRPGDAMVFNNTRVIPARLTGVRTRGDSTVRVEATLHQRRGPERWTAFMRPGKRLHEGDRVSFGRTEEGTCLLGALDATVESKSDDGEVALRFDLSGPVLDEAIALHGRMPLPPYIAARRGEDGQDRRDYQTIYAEPEGSVAAPTAGLHFTPEIFAQLDARGVSRHFVTLHVGAGTFLPVKVDDVSEHRMHAEYGEVSAETADALNAVRARGGRIVCVGTTSLRLLESAARPDGVIEPFAAETSIFITPGYAFRTADVLMTNFHLPKSTLFMLVSAFAGKDAMRAAYAHAVAQAYRFYSYGDACLLERA
jgi:S-adenosylmethionine:tRNA ribosyltransferase-isomerase